MTMPEQPNTPQPPVPQHQAPQPQYQQPQYQAPQPQYQQPQYQQPQYQQPYAYPTPGPGEPVEGAASPEDLTRPLYGATFGQSVRRFFKNYVNFNGRASRSEFWWAQLFLFLVMLAPLVLYIVGIGITIAGAEAGSSASYSSEGSSMSGADPLLGFGIGFLAIGGILMAAMWLGVLLPSLAIAWRRLHDANFAGPFYFLSLTSVGSIVVLVFVIMPSKVEGRRFDRR